MTTETLYTDAQIITVYFSNSAPLYIDFFEKTSETHITKFHHALTSTQHVIEFTGKIKQIRGLRPLRGTQGGTASTRFTGSVMTEVLK